jgi:hypothetical protein
MTCGIVSPFGSDVFTFTDIGELGFDDILRLNVEKNMI